VASAGATVYGARVRTTVLAAIALAVAATLAACASTPPPRQCAAETPPPPKKGEPIVIGMCTASYGPEIDAATDADDAAHADAGVDARDGGSDTVAP
jgi:hypothetical protein